MLLGAWFVEALDTYSVLLERSPGSWKVSISWVLEGFAHIFCSIRERSPGSWKVSHTAVLQDFGRRDVGRTTSRQRHQYYM